MRGAGDVIGTVADASSSAVTRTSDGAIVTPSKRARASATAGGFRPSAATRSTRWPSPPATSWCTTSTASASSSR